jgi:eukaryotic-like serine/threonine-protein kinase
MTEPSRIDDLAPRGYRVLFELGRGGMGAAFLARAEGAGGFERLVVIKRIRPERLDPRSVERFLREARVAAAIHHANVVSAQNVGQDGDGPFIVLDYVDGASLEELLDRSLLKQGALPVPILLRVALDTLAGLEAVHDARDAQGKPLNVLHRDVSLQNILVGRDGVARLLDFGIARSDLGGNTTDQHYIVGKLPYLPPEYLRREAMNESVDVYGLGVTLWLCLTGKEPWPGASEAQVLQHIVTEGIPRLPQALEVAPEVVELVASACAADRARRFSTAREMAAAIERLGRERGWLATHHEVAEWIEALCGTDLSRRRERIALSASAADPPRPAQPSHSQVTAPHAVPERLPTTRRGQRIALMIAAALVLIALLAWGVSSNSTPATTVPSAAAAPAAPPAEPSASAVVAIALTPASPTTPAPASSASSSPARPPAVRKPLTAPSEPSRPAAVRPPDQISKRNPYRD